MHKNTLGDAANGQKNHRSLLIVPLSRRSRVGRLAIGVHVQPPAEQQTLVKANGGGKGSPRDSIFHPSGAGFKSNLVNALDDGDDNDEGCMHLPAWLPCGNLICFTITNKLFTG